MDPVCRLKEGVVIHHDRGGAGCVVKDLTTGRDYAFGAVECFLLRHLLGRHAAGPEGRTEKVDPELQEALGRIDAFKEHLLSLGILQADSPATEPDEPVNPENSAPASEEKGPVPEPVSFCLRLFDPRPLLAKTTGALGAMRLLAWLSPLWVAVGLFVFYFHRNILLQEIAGTWHEHGFWGRLLLTAFTLNLVSQYARALVAHHLGLKVTAFGLVCAYGLLPRFYFQLAPKPSLPRRQQLLLAATPLVTKAVLFGGAALVWAMLRLRTPAVASMALETATLALLTLILFGNPFWKGDGYRLLALYLEAGDLRQQARQALRSYFRSDARAIRRHLRHRHALAAYAVLSYLFVGLIVTAALWLLYQRLVPRYGGIGFVLFVGLVAWIWRWIRNQRQKSLSHMAEAANKSMTRRRVNTVWWRFWGKIAVAVAILGVAWLPYRYDPSGPAEIQPADRRTIEAPIAGILEKIYFEGGEWVSADTLIARMEDVRQRRDVAVLEAEIARKRHEIVILENTPSMEQVRLAEEELRTARLAYQYSSKSLERHTKLRQQGIVSEQEYESVREQMILDLQAVHEKEAALAALKASVYPEEIQAKQEDLQALQAQLTYSKNQLEKTRLRMPISGRIVTLRLKELESRYLEEGDVVAEVEQTHVMRVSIYLPEGDIRYVRPDSSVWIKLWALGGKVVHGRVRQIAARVQAEANVDAVEVIVEVDNRDGLLKSGMRGYAKIKGEHLPLLLAFGQSVLRFLQVEMWAWVP